MEIPLANEQPTVSVNFAAEALGINVDSAYKAVKSGEIPVIKVGRLYLVPTAALRRLLQLDEAPQDVA